MSIFSRITYSYLDPVVFHANRALDVTVDDLPILPEEEKVEALAPKVLKVNSTLIHTQTNID